MENQTKYGLIKEANFTIILLKIVRFIRSLKTKICKYMTLVSKNVSIEKLDDTVGEYNNTYHRTIKMKPVNVKDRF